MQCPRCQQDHPSQAQFCLNCGTLFRRPDGNPLPAPSYADLQRALTEAREQQTATSEILRVISRAPTSLEPIAQAIADSAGRLCSCAYSAVFRFDGELIHWVAARGASGVQVDALRGVWPRPPDRETLVGRVVLARDTLHIRDAASDPTHAPSLPTARAALAIRSWLGVPMLRGDEPIGVIVLVRVEVRPFSEQEIALVQTFVSQAVIAIENVRLFKELEARNRELTEALDQQTATSEILGVIGRSQTDVQPVFETMAASALRLCDAKFSLICTYDGELLHIAVLHNVSPEHGAAMRDAFPMPPHRGGAAARAVLTRAVVHIPDVAADPEYQLRRLAETTNARNALSVPLLRDGEPIGAITVGGDAARPFSERQIALLQTFADQAVIAIENVRLFNETKEALEQQTASSEVLRVISSSPTDVQPVFDAIAQSAARLCEAFDAVVYRVEGDVLRPVTHHGSGEVGPIPLVPGTANGRAVIERRLVHVTDLQAETNEFPEGATISQREGTRSFVSVPLLREGRAIGTIAVRRFEIRPFGEKQIALLRTFADQAVIAIENARLFNETKEALEQQTATGEILKVIASSPTDVQPVFDAIARQAMRLCSASYGVVTRYDGQLLYLVAHAHVRPEGVEAIKRVFPMLPSRATTSSRAILERAVVHVPDALIEPDYDQSVALGLQNRSVLAVPMLHSGEPIGTISVGRFEPQPFTEAQIALLQTFADQAVIAIENVRLFKELEEKNRALTEAHARVTESLDQQTATSEILRAISQSHSDVQPIFDTITRNATRLCDGLFSSLY